MRQRGHVVRELDSQPEGPEFEFVRKLTGLLPACWNL